MTSELSHLDPEHGMRAWPARGSRSARETVDRFSLDRVHDLDAPTIIAPRRR